MTGGVVIDVKLMCRAVEAQDITVPKALCRLQGLGCGN